MLPAARREPGGEFLGRRLVHPVIDQIGNDARLRERGLSLQGYKLMRALEDCDLSMREISEALHISPRTVTDMIDGLEARGMVARCPYTEDRRVTLVTLTSEGRSQLAAAAAGAEQASHAAVNGLSESDQKTLRVLLDQVAPADRSDCPPGDR